MSIKYVDPEDYNKAKDAAWKTVSLLAKKVDDQKQDIYVKERKIDVLTNLLEEERSNKTVQQFEKVGGSEDWGQQLAQQIQRAMAPLTDDIKRNLEQDIQNFERQMRK